VADGDPLSELESVKIDCELDCVRVDVSVWRAVHDGEAVEENEMVSLAVVEPDIVEDEEGVTALSENVVEPLPEEDVE
jgi:hypothetical protein